MDYPPDPNQYAKLYAQWRASFNLMLKLAECFCGNCIICGLIRPSVLAQKIKCPNSRPSLPEGEIIEQEYDDEEDYSPDDSIYDND